LYTLLPKGLTGPDGSRGATGPKGQKVRTKLCMKLWDFFKAGFLFVSMQLMRCCSLSYNNKTFIEYRPVGLFSLTTKQLPFSQPATLRSSIFSNGEALSILLYCNYAIVICSGNQNSET